MKVIIKRASVTLAAAALASCSGTPDDPDTSSGTSPEISTETQAAQPSAGFVAADFEIPVLVETEGFKIVPLGPDLVDVDYAAYMSSITHLQETFTRSTGWPREGITDDEAMKDMETEEARFEARSSFAYAVLTPDGSRERGCIYVYPSEVEGYDAVVTMWVTKAEYDAGFDEEFYAWATDWIAKDWPFQKVAYPGRSIEWDEWDALTGKGAAIEGAT